MAERMRFELPIFRQSLLALKSMDVVEMLQWVVERVEKELRCKTTVAVVPGVLKEREY